MWPVTIVLMNAGLRIQDGGEEIHVIVAVSVMLRSISKKPTHPSVGWSVWSDTRSQEASFPKKVIAVQSLKELAGGKVILNRPKYTGFHTRACAQPGLWWRLKPIIETWGVL